MEIFIHHNSGSYGNLVAASFNMLTGNSITNYDRNQNNFDHVNYIKKPIFITKADYENKNDYKKIIGVTIEQNYLNYLAALIYRTSGLCYDIDTLHIDILGKMEKHPVLKFFIEGLNFYNVKGKHISKADLRDFLRGCFIKNNYSILKEVVSPKFNFDYTIHFDEIYDIDNFLNHCGKILQSLNIDVIDKYDEIHNMINNLLKNYPYKNTQEPWHIVDCIENDVNSDIKLNVLEEAWLDDYLINKYGIEPLLIDSYPNTVCNLKTLYCL